MGMQRLIHRTLAQPGMNTGDGSNAGRVASPDFREDVGSNPTGAAICLATTTGAKARE